MAKKKQKTVFVKSKLDLKGVQVKTKSFLESIRTLHGMNYISVLKGRSLLFWSTLMMINILWTTSFVMLIKHKYDTDQIVTKINSDWSVNRLPFPAISICNYNMVSQRESMAIKKILLKRGISNDEAESFFSVLPLLKDYSQGAADVHQSCKSLLIYCEFNGKEKDCNEVFTRIQTIEGHCCTFNYNGVDAEDEDPTMVQDNDFEYYIDEDPDGESVETSLIATSQSGSTSGLKVVFDVEPNDYANWSLAPAYGAKMLLSDPNDYPETRVLYRYMGIGDSIDVKVEPRFYNCESSLRHIEPQRRGCWFHDEVNLINTNRYSYETCHTECRIKSFVRFCGCVPYKYPVDKTTRICELADLPCLNYMRVNWARTRQPCVPECYKECRDKEYYFVGDTTPFFAEEFPPNVTRGRNISELISLHVYYMQSTCNCYTMSQLNDFNFFIGTYGGIFSLYFGASIITIFELIYLSIASIFKNIWPMLFEVINVKRFRANFF
ncbi:pickpocket protein 28-like [Pectinophora gossypiella]|uniref:pickpocket protein 28-like n=1 Tax=Pectinophora gossypiella TaxID=13191 RepID=UPI00214EAF85|nr:pickpocket protein 28-like [Pectinophora gossypiella]